MVPAFRFWAWFDPRDGLGARPAAGYPARLRGPGPHASAADLAMLSFCDECRKVAGSGVSHFSENFEKTKTEKSTRVPLERFMLASGNVEGPRRRIPAVAANSPVRGIESARRGKISPCYRWIDPLVDVHLGILGAWSSSLRGATRPIEVRVGVAGAFVVPGVKGSVSAGLVV
jgi:hypothetical protein